MVRKTKRLGYRKNKSSRRKFRGGGGEWWNPFASKKEEPTITDSTSKLSIKEEYDKKVKGCLSLQKYQPNSLPTECNHYLANQMYVETVNPVGVKADADTRKSIQSGLSSTGGRRRRSRRYRRKN